MVKRTRTHHPTTKLYHITPKYISQNTFTNISRHYKKYVLLRWFFAAGAKISAICRILRCFLGPPVYIGSIVALFLDCCYNYGLLQCPTVVRHKTAAINISFCADTIAVVEKNATICEL